MAGSSYTRRRSARSRPTRSSSARAAKAGSTWTRSSSSGDAATARRDAEWLPVRAIVRTRSVRPGHARRTLDPAQTTARGPAVARAMWKGAIQFGLVTIPVKLYVATESSYTIRFNMLHEKDQTRIQRKTWCPEEDKPISRADTVKGYEYSPGEY